MRNHHCAPAFLLLFLLVPAALSAQSVVIIPPQQCVWRAGDDPAWAAPSLEESSWQPYTQWQPSPGQARFWIRCHADLRGLRGLAQPALQVSLYAAYELYLNGQLVARAGNLSTSNFSLDAMRAYPVPTSLLAPAASTLALRVSMRRLVFTIGGITGLAGGIGQLHAGDRSTLDGLRARTILAEIAIRAEASICFSVIGVLAVMLLGLYFYDRSRHELLLLSVACLCMATVRVNEFCAAAMLHYSFLAAFLIALVCNIVLPLTVTPFFFVVARRRVSLFFRALIALSVLEYLFRASIALLVTTEPAWFAHWIDGPRRFLGVFVRLLLTLAPFFAFWPYKRIARTMRPLAALCMLWALVEFAWIAVETTNLPIPGVPRLFAAWSSTLIEVRAFTTAGVLAGLLGLLFREQRQVTQERAMLAGEMRAARAVQQVIIPAENPAIPGFRIESVYRPASEVGGDFFQILPTAAGGALIVIGDVSGKGMPAALTVSLLVGTVRTLAHYTQSPGEILAAMNQRMLARSQGGFTTCLVLRVDPTGRLTVANAGHLPPYLDGKELALENGLPLGLGADSTYAESTFQLAPRARLTLLSDGVVEARNIRGELFGFERTAKISLEPAEKIARAAEAFGQEDDITVLTLAFAPAGVSHA